MPIPISEAVGESADLAKTKAKQVLNLPRYLRVVLFIPLSEATETPARSGEDRRSYSQILAEDLPYINLWYFDNVMVYSKRVRGLNLNPSGNYDFLRTAELENR